MVKRKGSDQVLVIAGKGVHVTHGTMDIEDVRLDADNPRTRFQLRQTGKTKPSQEDLQNLIKAQPAYDDLHKAIRKAGGLHDAVIVRHNGTVVEGNTRVTVISTLHKGSLSDPRWKRLPIVRLPKDVPPESIAMLMASYHIAGKNTWQAFAKADQIYHLKHKYGCSVEQIADETRTTKRDIEQQLQAYEFLIKEVMPKAGKGSDLTFLMGKWSHAIEFMKIKALAPMRKDPRVRKTLGKLLINNQIKGVEVRDFAKVLANGRARKVLQRGGGFKEAKAALKKADPTVESLELRQIKKLTSRLSGLKEFEWKPFKTDTRAQRILGDHAKALHFLMKMIGMKVPA